MSTSEGQVRIAIVADDLTGAGDSAAQFVGPSVDVRLVLSPDQPVEIRDVPDVPDGPAAARTLVAAYPTDSRALPADAAAAATARGVAHAVDRGADRLFVKVDSTMRGSAAAQITGALSEWRRTRPGAFAVVCPAYPRMGRTVEDAVVRVRGRDVADSAAAVDAVSAMSASDLSTLLPGSTHVSSAGTPADTPTDAFAASLAAAGRRAAVVTVDARTDADLELIAAAIVSLAGAAVPVGSAGLASAMAAAWLPDGREIASARAGDPTSRVLEHTARRAVPQRVLIVLSSLHEVSRSQATTLAGELPEGRAVVLEPTDRDLSDRGAADRWSSSALSVASDGGGGHGGDGGGVPGVALLMSPVPTPDGRLRADTVADSLARVALDVIRWQGTDTLVLVGGDGARAVLDASAAHGVRIEGQLLEGVVCGEVVGGELDRLRLLTKAGGFGDARTLIDVLRTVPA